MARKLEVEIIGDASSLQRALGNATRSTSGLHRGLTALAKVAAVGVGAAFAGLALTVREGFHEIEEGEQVAGQTAAALKSTGKAANVTAREVTDLAEAQAKLTGIDDEAVQAGENMLLTFTKVRNEVGKGNDIFNQATVAVEDMATRMNAGAIPSMEQLNKTAIRVGKALNDPIKGTTALARVGVLFTEEQKKQIKEMVKAGDTMGAQKLILKELTTEFGGSAKAAGQTMTGQLRILKNEFDEVAAKLAVKFLPILTGFVSWVNQHWPEISAVFAAVGDAVTLAFEGIGKAAGVVRAHFDTIKKAGQELFDFFDKHQTVFIVSGAAIASVVAFTELYRGLTAAIAIATAAQTAFNIAVLANPYVAVAAAVAALVGALVALYLTSDRARKIMDGLFSDLRTAANAVIPYLQAIWARFGDSFIAVGQAIYKTVTTAFENMLAMIRGFVNIFAGVFTGDWRRVWTGITQLFNAFVDNTLGLLRAWVHAMTTVSRQVGAALLDGISAALGKIIGVIAKTASEAYNKAAEVGMAIVNGIKKGVGDAVAAAGSWIKDQIVKFIVDPVKSIVPGWGSTPYTWAFGQIGMPITQGIAEGAKAGAPAMMGAISTVVQNATKKAQEAVDAARTKYKESWDAFANKALDAFDEMSSKLMTKSEILLANLNKQQTVTGLQDAITEAQKNLDVAKISQAWNQVMLPDETVADWAARAQAANDAVTSAQKQLNDALLAQKQYGLEQRAAAERTALDDTIELTRSKFAEWLALRTTQHDLATAKEAEGQSKIVAKIQSYAPLYKQQGIALGASLAAGLRDAQGWVEDAAQALADAMNRAVGVAANVRTQAKTTADNLGNQRERIGGMAEGGVVTRPTLTWVAERGPEAVIPLSQMGSASASPTYVFQFPNYVGDREDLISEVRRGLYEVSRRNPGAIPGAA